MGKFDLVIPVLSEHCLDILETDKFIECCDRCRQIVVNDFGVLQYLNNKYELRLGRLFFRDYRDHRYEEYDSSSCCGKANTVLDFVSQCGIRAAAYENDIITTKYGCSEYNFSGKTISRYLHYPYRQISMSHICEFASIGKRIEDKFIPDDLCSMQCFGLYMKFPEYNYIKMGRGVYDILDEKYLENMEENDGLIITPRISASVSGKGVF